MFSCFLMKGPCEVWREQVLMMKPGSLHWIWGGYPEKYIQRWRTDLRPGCDRDQVMGVMRTTKWVLKCGYTVQDMVE
ncbi:mCG140362, isoform CRA_a [Mus musculus]|nr:mCG140362, isoform CRA_a [Mus musculus]